MSYKIFINLPFCLYDITIYLYKVREKKGPFIDYKINFLQSYIKTLINAKESVLKIKSNDRTLVNTKEGIVIEIEIELTLSKLK